MVASYVPDRGDVIWVDFSPNLGHEQGGRRPALVLSSTTYNGPSKLMVVCPITTKIKRYPFEVPIKTGKINGVVLADQIKNLSWSSRPIKFEAKAKPDLVERAQDLIQTLLKG